MYTMTQIPGQPVLIPGIIPDIPAKPKAGTAPTGQFLLNPDGTLHIGPDGRVQINDPKGDPCCEEEVEPGDPCGGCVGNTPSQLTLVASGIQWCGGCVHGGASGYRFEPSREVNGTWVLPQNESNSCAWQNEQLEWGQAWVYIGSIDCSENELGPFPLRGYWVVQLLTNIVQVYLYIGWAMYFNLFFGVRSFTPPMDCYNFSGLGVFMNQYSCGHVGAGGLIKMTVNGQLTISP